MKKSIIIITSIISSILTYGQRIITLEESKEWAIKNNIQIKNSELETEAARQTKKKVFTNYFPKVSASALAFRSADYLINLDNPGGNLPVYDGNPANIPAATQFAYLPPSTINMFDKGFMGALNVSLPVYTGGQITAGNKLARLDLEVKEQQQIITTNEIILKTEQQYWQVVSLQEKKAALDKYEQLLANIDKQVNDSFKSGLIVKNDRLKVQIKLNEIQANKKSLYNGKKLALMQFCQTIGIPYDSALVLSNKTLPSADPQNYFMAPEAALVERAEYMLIKKSINAEELQTRMKNAEYYPKVMAGATGYYLNAMDNGGVVNGLAFLSLSIPISNFWGYSYSLKERHIKEKITENNAADKELLLQLQIEKVWMDLNELFDQIQFAEKLKEQSLENLKTSKDQYLHGLVTVTDVLEAHALLLEVENKLIDAQFKYQIAITVYKQVTGR